MEEMEQKRRDEENYALQQERIHRKLQGENMKQSKAEDNDVGAEIAKLANGTVYDAY
jgi:hypothetical protein